MDERPISMTTFERLCLAGTMVTIGFAVWFRYSSHETVTKAVMPDVHQTAPTVSTLAAVMADIVLFLPYLLALLIVRRNSRLAVWVLYAWELWLLVGAAIVARKSGLGSADFAQPALTALFVGLGLVALNSPDSRKWRARRANA
jgi:hypothetical protein